MTNTTFAIINGERIIANPSIRFSTDSIEDAWAEWSKPVDASGWVPKVFAQLVDGEWVELTPAEIDAAQRAWSVRGEAREAAAERAYNAELDRELSLI